MSIQSALFFIQRARAEDRLLQERIRALGPDASLEGLVQVGAEAGLEFSVEELRAAYKHDWGIRWVYFRQRADNQHIPECRRHDTGSGSGDGETTAG